MSIATSISEFSTTGRTQRVLARIPVHVTGRMSGKVSIQESTFTVAVNPNGALLPLPQSVRKGQLLTLLNSKTGQQEQCIVVFVDPCESGYANVRVQFMEPHPEFWRIMFPPCDWTPNHRDSKFRKASRSN